MNIKTSSLQGRVALVTGGGRGIGRAIALELAEHGCDLMLCYRKDSKAIEGLCASIKQKGRQVLALQADIGREADVVTLFNAIGDHYNRLDILVNNAGWAMDSLLATTTADDMLAVLGTNLVGTMLCCREALRFMLPQRSGSIINISSISARQANRGQTAYAAAKGGVEAFTRALALELRGRGILVNGVAPGVIETSLTKNLLERERRAIISRLLVGEVGLPEDISRAVLFLADPENRYINGEVLPVNGGMTLS